MIPKVHISAHVSRQQSRLSVAAQLCCYHQMIDGSRLHDAAAATATDRYDARLSGTRLDKYLCITAVWVTTHDRNYHETKYTAQQKSTICGIAGKSFWTAGYSEWVRYVLYGKLYSGLFSCFVHYWHKYVTSTVTLRSCFRRKFFSFRIVYNFQLFTNSAPLNCRPYTKE